MKKLNQYLNNVMGALVGIFLGRGLYVAWNYFTRPGLYAMQSAPWYTSLLVHGVITLILLIVCLVIKAVIKFRK